MGEAVIGIIVTLAACAAAYLLYINGVGGVNAKIALKFIGTMNGNKASFTSCSGYMKRVVRFKEDKICSLSLDCLLKKGDFSVELLNSSKQVVMRLGPDIKSASAAVEAGKRYYLVLRFKSATGDYLLRWE